MEIKELSFLENLANNGNETSAKDSVIGGHSYDYSHSYSYDFDSYFSHPVFDKLKDFDFGNIVIKVTKPKPEPEPEPEFDVAFSISSIAAVPDSPFG